MRIKTEAQAQQAMAQLSAIFSTTTYPRTPEELRMIQTYAFAIALWADREEYEQCEKTSKP